MEKSSKSRTHSHGVVDGTESIGSNNSVKQTTLSRCNSKILADMKGLYSERHLNKYRNAGKA